MQTTERHGGRSLPANKKAPKPSGLQGLLDSVLPLAALNPGGFQ